jgi:hypothetical protein
MTEMIKEQRAEFQALVHKMYEDFKQKESSHFKDQPDNKMIKPDDQYLSELLSMGFSYKMIQLVLEVSLNNFEESLKWLLDPPFWLREIEGQLDHNPSYDLFSKFQDYSVYEENLHEESIHRYSLISLRLLSVKPSASSSSSSLFSSMTKVPIKELYENNITGWVICWPIESPLTLLTCLSKSNSIDNEEVQLFDINNTDDYGQMVEGKGTWYIPSGEPQGKGPSPI